MLVNEKTGHALKEIIRKQGWAEFPSAGTSMYPVILEGDIGRFVPFETQDLKQGDIVLFQDRTGKLITHRFLHADPLTKQYIFKGDTNARFDEPISEEQIIGKLISIRRKNTTLHLQRYSMRIWGYLVVRFPILSALLRSYLNKHDKNR